MTPFKDPFHFFSILLTFFVKELPLSIQTGVDTQCVELKTLFFYFFYLKPSYSHLPLIVKAAANINRRKLIEKK